MFKNALKMLAIVAGSYGLLGVTSTEAASVTYTLDYDIVISDFDDDATGAIVFSKTIDHFLMADEVLTFDGFDIVSFTNILSADPYPIITSRFFIGGGDYGVEVNNLGVVLLDNDGMTLVSRTVQPAGGGTRPCDLGTVTTCSEATNHGTYELSVVSAVPLPAGALLLFSGLAGLGLARRRA